MISPAPPEIGLEHFKSVLDEHAILAVTDARGVIVEVNDKFCEISQFARHELLGRSHKIVNSGVHPRTFWTEMWRTISSGRAWRSDVCNRAKDGSLYWVDTTIQPVLDADGRVLGHIALRSLITERKVAEQRLQEHGHLLQTILDLLPQRVFWKDRQSRYLGANNAFLRDTGTPDLIGKTDFQMPWRHEEAEFYRACDARVMTSGTAELGIVESQRTASGDEVKLRTNKVPLRDARGDVIGIVGTYEDITSTAKAAERLASERARLEAFVEHVPAAVAMLDRECCYVVASKRWATSFGVEFGSLAGRSHYEVFPNLPERWKEVHRRALAGEVLRSDNDCWRPPGADADQFLSWEVRPWREPDGEIGGIVILAQDTTELQIRALELARLHDAADAANEAKSEFVAKMSHEIRTPLTAILGYADLLQDLPRTDLADEHRELVRTIRRAGQHLLSIVNDVLDLSRVEAGTLRVDSVPTDLPGLLDEVVQLLRPRAEEKHVELELRAEGRLPAQVRTDATRLRQILLNLAGNAVKFTTIGKVVITVSVVGESAEAKLRLDVEDTGPGIAESDASRLFTPFVQADNSHARRHGGCGLGLVISRKLARLLGGDVMLVRSRPSEGSLFRAELPLRVLPAASATEIRSAAAAPISEATTPAPRLSGRILLVEDGIDNQRLIARILRVAGAQVEVAENGRIALEALERARVEGLPDLVVTDMQMPELDGYELARELRSRGFDRPILALTAHAMTEDRQRCLDAGCDDFTTKPIERAAFLRTCACWIGKRVSARTGPDHS